MRDIDMREPLFDYLDERYKKIRVLEEKIIYNSRADVIGITDDAIIGFEIKSDQDTYQRLNSQIKDYEKYCDLCFLVIGKKHEKQAAKHVPSYWGIIVVEDDLVYLLREALSCPHVEIKYQIDLLWRRELDKILLDLSYPAYKSYSKKKVEERIIEKTEILLLKKIIRDILMDRDYTIFDEKKPILKRKFKSIKKTLHTSHYIGRGGMKAIKRKRRNVKKKVK